MNKYIQEEADIITVVLCIALFLSRIFFKNGVLIIKGIFKVNYCIHVLFKTIYCEYCVSIILYLWSLYFDILKAMKKNQVQAPGYKQ